MAAKSGVPSLTKDTIEAVRDELVPRATVITPNLPEAELLLGRSPTQSLEEMADRAVELHLLDPDWVLLTGRHLDNAESVDIDVSIAQIGTQNGDGRGGNESKRKQTVHLLSRQPALRRQNRRSPTHGRQRSAVVVPTK